MKSMFETHLAILEEQSVLGLLKHFDVPSFLIRTRAKASSVSASAPLRGDHYVTGSESNVFKVIVRPFAKGVKKRT